MTRHIRLFTVIAMAAVALSARCEITLDYCLDKARENYPVIKQYRIVENSCAIDLSDINKSWLPQADIYLQGTVQNSVPQFPGAISDIMSRFGQSLEGLGKVQYKVGAEVSQTIWDGGQSKSRREVARAQSAQEQASLDVEMYSIRERVESLFFGILLLEQQIKQIQATLVLVEDNLKQMQAMYRNGTAMQYDVDMLEAKKLNIIQQIASARGNAQQYRSMLSVYVGEDIGNVPLAKPSITLPDVNDSRRPELALFDAMKSLNDSRLSSIKASLMPRIGFFAQAYYGYPGFDYFSAMRSRDLNFNILAGIKVSWNLSSLYSRNNNISRIRLANLSVDAERERFMFENNIKSKGQQAEIATMHDVMEQDNKIISLRTNVRKAAESQLANGVIDATALLTKITDENQARLSASYHEIKLLQLIYQLKNILNQ